MNFGGDEVKYSYDDSTFVIVPVPYDQTSTWIKGSEKGPAAILEASVNLEFYDIETSTQAHLKGIFTAGPVVSSGSPEALTDAVYDRVMTLLKAGKYPVIIGGNHTVTIGSVRAFADYFGKLSVLQLDAHTDLREEYEGSRYNHACVMARVREKAEIVQVGIRSLSAGEVPLTNRERLFFAHNLYYDKSLYRKALNKLTENVYITIDLDVFDPSLIPSTGTPEPGGPDYFELMHFLAEVIREKNVVGFDVVELCPSPDNKVPDFVAAKIIYQLLSYVVAKTFS
ncbi:MAG: agmatinase [Bacteroidales bacterium]|nr:agmatinase [Bacteroidales bacterium]